MEESEDLTQEFFAQLLVNHRLDHVIPDSKKLHAFLLSSLDHFLANEWRKSHAAKRGSGCLPLSLDDTADQRHALEPATDLDPEKMLERRRVLDLLETAQARLSDRYRENGSFKLFDLLKEFLSDDARNGDYARLEAELTMSAAAISTAVCRLRQRYRGLVRDEIARDVANPQEIDEELRALFLAVT